MSEQELFEMMDRWADAKGVLRLKKRKEEEPPFAMPVDSRFAEVYPPSMDTPARKKLLDELLCPPAAGEKPRRGPFALSDEEIQITEDDLNNLEKAAREMIDKPQPHNGPSESSGGSGKI